jgi:hypothetical protein
MKITWNDISSNIVYSKLTGVEPNPIFKEIHSFLQYWIPSIVQDTRVTINNKYSYYYNSKNKYLYIEYKNIWSVFESKYGMEYDDIQTLIIGYAVSTHNIEVKHTNVRKALKTTIAVSTHNIEVKHTILLKMFEYLFAVSTHNIEVKNSGYTCIHGFLSPVSTHNIEVEGLINII